MIVEMRQGVNARLQTAFVLLDSVKGGFFVANKLDWLANIYLKKLAKNAIINGKLCRGKF